MGEEGEEEEGVLIASGRRGEEGGAEERRRRVEDRGNEEGCMGVGVGVEKIRIMQVVLSTVAIVIVQAITR